MNRCSAVSKVTGLQCRYYANHMGAHEPGNSPETPDLDDDSEAALAYQERRDDELAEESDDRA